MANTPASIICFQPPILGITLSSAFTPEVVNGVPAASAATGVLRIATSSIDSQGFLQKNLTYAANTATITFSTAELILIYGAVAVTASIYIEPLAMVLTAVDAEEMSSPPKQLSPLLPEQPLSLQML